MTVDTIPPHASTLQRVLVGKLPRLLRVVSGGQEHVFVVVDADETALRIREIVLAAPR
jgi:hypothetical protein